MTIKFRDKLLGLLLIVLAIAAAAFVIASDQMTSNIQADIVDRLAKSRTTYDEYTSSFFNQLILQVNSAADNPKFNFSLATNDKPTIQYAVEEYQNNLEADLLMAVNVAGDIMGNVGYQTKGSSNIAQLPEVSGAIREAVASGGFWVVNDSLYWITATPAIIGQTQLFGALVLGKQITDERATVISRVTNNHVAFLVGGQIVAKDSANDRKELLEELKKHRELLDQAMIRKQTSDPFYVKLQNETFIALASPIVASPGYEGMDDKVLGTFIFYSSLDNALRPLRAATQIVIYIGLGGGAIILLIGFALINGVTRPVTQLFTATKEIAAGNLDYRVNVKSRDELGQLSMQFNQMSQGLKEKERVEGLFGKYLSPEVARKVLSEQSIDGILKGEKVKLSVMFTDIRGFTPLSRGMDPQALINLLNSHFDEMIDIIDRYGGTLDKFIGDAIMAFFGAPVHYDDFYMRAINAAVQMQRASEKFNFQRKLEGKDPISIGVGINTGEVVVGNIGSNKRLEYTVIGETVNIANRLCSVAQKGQIIVSQSTYDLLESKTIARSIDNVKLKGVDEAVTVYEILWKG